MTSNMPLLPLVLLSLLSPAFCAWSRETMQQGNLSREYYVYTPSSGGSNGLMMFFHGNYMTDDFPDGGQIAPWQVAQNAEQYGFVGVVPKGSPCPDTKGKQPLFHWNVLDASGPNEVQFAHAIVEAVSRAHSIHADAPRIILGFSNGAAMADMLGCHNGSSLYVAHVGTYYHPNADFPSTCEQTTDPCSKWSGVGTEDPFIGWIGVAGLRGQFVALHNQYGCSGEMVNSTRASGSCSEYPQCQALGQLCVFENTTHEIKPGMTSAAWTYLNGMSGPARCAGTSGPVVYA